MSKQVTSHYIEHFGEDDQHKFSPGIQKLMDEHIPLLSQIEGLLSQIKQTSTMTKTKWNELLKDHEDFTSNLVNHSEREERLLFEVMKERIGTTYGPIEIMEEEHEEIHRNLEAFSNKASKLEDVPNDDIALELFTYLKQANEVMLQHFYKEEHAIYPMAEDLLSEDEKELLFNKLS